MLQKGTSQTPQRKNTKQKKKRINVKLRKIKKKKKLLLSRNMFSAAFKADVKVATIHFSRSRKTMLR